MSCSKYRPEPHLRAVELAQFGAMKEDPVYPKTVTKRNPCGQSLFSNRLASVATY
jgi:hypothetical protein